MSMPTLLLPILIGRNRLRGKSEGAMVYDDFGSANLDSLRALLKREFQFSGVEFDEALITTSVSQLLRLYEAGHAEWLKFKNGTVGWLADWTLPSGAVIRAMDHTMIARFGSCDAVTKEGERYHA